MPQTADIKNPAAEARNEYTYAASGVKLKSVQKWNPNYSTAPVIGSAVNASALTMTKNTDYVGNIIFENNALKRILMDGGYIEGGNYYFYLADHLGNNHVVIRQDGVNVQNTDYYPYGESMTHSSGNAAQPYKFGGKEYDAMHGLNLYDFSARMQDPAIGRFTTMDPLAEKKPWLSPYIYCSDNPVNRVDPDGQFDFTIPGVTPLPIWYIDMPATGKAMVELAKKAGVFIKTAVVIGVAQQVVNIEKTINGENGQNVSQTNGENKTQEKKDEPGTRRRGQNKAKDHAKVPRESKGGENIEMDELNESSRGKNYEKMKEDGAKSLERRNPNGKNKYEEHPDGHSDAGDAAHHDSGHFHSTNAKGETKIFPYK